ncbi:hypothetical protein ONE63_010086 [Megalurothrips usitatus]|uniref:Uncharacterized protein n=1 Tax=Megalurothrips usitatus TaxID=439358 RepID=A0AAV7XIF3_9NEOP|nr:hypothetical protein ONE63_010086 [Megalurothrips usitatus]
MPAKPAPGRLSLPATALALAVLTAAVLAEVTPDNGNGTSPPPRRLRHNDRAPHSAVVGHVPDAPRAEGRGDQYTLISTSGNKGDKGPPPVSPSDKVSSADLPVADKQYEYPLVRPVYAPFVTRPAMPTYAAMPYVEILDHHRDPPYLTHHKPGAPMVSTVVVQDMSQTPLRPQSSLTVEHEESESEVDNFHHIGPTKIPFTDLQVVSKPIGSGADTKHSANPNFTDKLEEASLEDASDDSEEDIRPLISDPENLDVGGIVEDVVRKVFRENHILHDAASMIPAPGKSWPCPPVTCCTKAKKHAPRPEKQKKWPTLKMCLSLSAAGRSPVCPVRSERVPQALALSKPSNGYTAAESANSTDSDADVRDGEPRFKKKKILKKKKKLLKKFLLPLLLAYKLLFMLIVPLLVNGMMMMMGSSGMAGFFFALIGASVTMGAFGRPQHVVGHPVSESKTRTEVVTVAGSDWSGQESAQETMSVVSE